MAVPPIDERLRRWPTGMALEIGVYLLVMALSAAAALAASLLL